MSKNDNIIYGNGINIYYKTYGSKKDKPSLVFIGGLTRDHTIWSGIADYFAEDFYVITYDNRGAGQTDKPLGCYTSEMLAEDLFCVINALEVKSAYIVGHSMGGFAAQYFAAKYPQRVIKLILCSTCIKQSVSGVKYLTERLAILNSGVDTETGLRLALPWIFSQGFLTNDKINEIINQATQNLFPQPSYAQEAQIYACLNHDSSKIIEQIKCPTLILNGRKDKIISPKIAGLLAKKIVNASFKIIDDVGHMVQLEQPQQFCKIITEFISG